MGAGVVSIGRRTYAVGLYWENSPEGRVAQTAKEAARQPGQQAEFYAVRPGNKEGRVPQFGLGQKAAGHKSGMPSFAACLALQLAGAWAGAFRLREGTAVIIVRDDLIVPDGDLLFDNESDARDRLLQEMSFGGLQKIYAPEAWAIPNADTMPVTLLINDRKDIVLRPTAIPKKLIIGMSVGVGILLLLAGGGWYWQSMVEEEEALRIQQEEIIRRAQENARKVLPGSMQKTVEFAPPKRLWEEVARPLDVIESCRQGLKNIPLAVYGWQMGSLVCSGGKSLSFVWTRVSGTSSIPPLGAVVDRTADKASMNIQLPPLRPRGAEDLLDPDAVTARYIGQNWAGTLAVAPDDPPPISAAGDVGIKPPPPPWVKRSFTVNVPELPSVLPVYWTGMPGVVVYSAEYSGSDWTVNGVIYENRK